jgi:hypothetical protein
MKNEHERRFHDVGLPNWPMIMIGESHIRVIGISPTVGGRIFGWSVVALGCFAAWAAITWFSFGYAFRSVDWMGYYEIPPRKEEIWAAVIASGVAWMVLPVISVACQLCGSPREVIFTEDAIYISGQPPIPRRDRNGHPVEVCFWMTRSEELEQKTEDASFPIRKHILERAFQVEVGVKSRISQTSLPVTIIITHPSAAKFVSVCNAANQLSLESDERESGWGVID